MTSLPSHPALDLDRDGDWLTVWFNEPARRNPLSTARMEALMDLCAHLHDDRSLRGVTLRGRGGVFSAGGDLRAFRDRFQDDDPARRGDIERMSRAAGALFLALDRLPQVTVMAIEGAAVAGGMGLICAGDFALATQDSRFGLSETRLGLSPAQIAPYVLRRVGPVRGRQMMLTGALIAAPRALEIGLIDQVAPDVATLDAAIATLREQVRQTAPGAVAEVKEMIAVMGAMTPDERINRAASGFATRILSAEGREGVGSFLDKRKPDWAGGAS